MAFGEAKELGCPVNCVLRCNVTWLVAAIPSTVKATFYGAAKQPWQLDDLSRR